jgi:hypothetical protein
VADYVIPISSLDNVTLWASVLHGYPFCSEERGVVKDSPSIEYPLYKVLRIKKCKKRKKDAA